MDTLLTDGLTVTVIGVGTVFTALVSLTLLVTLLGRLGSQSPAAAGPGATGPDTGGAETPPGGGNGEPSSGDNSSPEPFEEPAVDLTRVALAAYGMHRRYRVETASARDATTWVHAGRVRDTASFER